MAGPQAALWRFPREQERVDGPASRRVGLGEADAGLAELEVGGVAVPHVARRRVRVAGPVGGEQSIGGLDAELTADAVAQTNVVEAGEARIGDGEQLPLVAGGSDHEVDA